MKTIKKTSLFLAYSGLLIIAACGTQGNQINSEIPVGKIPVKVWNIEKHQGAIQLHGSGQFTTDDETILSFKTGGIISQLMVSEGDFIQKGQVLATLDLTEINTAVAQAQLGYEKALRDFERIQRLLADSVVTLELAQNSKTALDMASQSLEAIQFNKEYSQIRAPKQGYVLKKFANAGQQIGAGSPVFQTNGAGNNSWKLKVAVSDRDWAIISEGDSANIRTAVIPEKELKARVSRKAQQVDPMTGAYTVELQFTESVPEYLASGMFGTADIFTFQQNPSWNIPYEALLDANGGYGFVFVTTDREKAKKISVKIGDIYPDYVQILEGLEDYSLMIVSGSAYLTDQSPIQIQQ